MGERPHEPRPSQCRGGRLRQQAGQDRLGGAAAERAICPNGQDDGGVAFSRSHPRRATKGVCERVTTRWPDSRTALRKPGSKNGARRRDFYEDRSARISILAGGCSSRPDTLKQTDQPPSSTNPLADGAGHTFLNVTPWRSKKRQSTETEKRWPQFWIRRSWISSSVMSGVRRIKPSK